MDPENPISIADVVISTAGRDQGELFYVADINDQFETRVAAKLRCGDKVLNGELRRDLAFLAREFASE